MLKLSIPPLMLLMFACDADPPAAPQLQQAQHPVIYGADDRQDVYAHPDEALRALTQQSIVSIVRLSRIDRSNPDGFTFGDRRLGPSLNLCEGERFAEQVRAGSCSGTLIGPRTVLTAGHCIDASDCHERGLVFDRFYRAEGELETVTAEDVYPCRRVLAWADDDDADFAVIELDRRVTPDRVPAPVRAIEPLPVDTPLTMIGFPNGIPAKIDTGGRVIHPGEAPWQRFEATVDAFGGNSGSGIFNIDGQLVAILEGGRTDYVDDGECRRANDLADDVDDAENLVYVGRAMDALCVAEPFHELCEPPFKGASWCDACVDAADCRPGWSCDGTCRAPCADDTTCRSDHRCIEGFCAPHTRVECRGETVWTVPACAIARAEQDCAPEQICDDGACREPNPGDRCAEALEIPSESAMYAGQTVEGLFNRYEGECGGDAPEVVYTFSVDGPTRLIASATGFDTLLHLRRDCDDDQEIACNDDRARGEVHALLRAELDPGTYHLFMDGYRNGGEYALAVDFRPPCEGGCELGAGRCTADGASRCARGDDDCPRWTEPDPCAPNTQCQAGVCVLDGDTCANPIMLPVEDAVIEGDLSNHTGTVAGSCGGAGPERVYQIEVEHPTRLQAALAGDAPIVFVRSACDADDAELSCVAGDGGPARLDAVLPAGIHHLVVDSEDAEAGAFILSLDFECEACPDPPDMSMPDASAPDAAPLDAAVEDAAVADAMRDAIVDGGQPDMHPDAAPLLPDMAPDTRVSPDMLRMPEDRDMQPDAERDSGPPPDALVPGDDCRTTPGQSPGWAALWLLALLGRARRAAYRH